MSDIVEFIAARLDEDEALAEAASTFPYEGLSWADHVLACERDTTPEMDAFVATHDPARVLREVAAMRAIVEHHRAEPFEDAPDEFYCRVCDSGIGGFYPCPTLRALASIWADHEAYDEEWAK